MANPPLSERERMLRGEAYNSRDPELLVLGPAVAADAADFDMGWSSKVVVRHDGSSHVALATSARTEELTHAEPVGQPSHNF